MITRSLLIGFLLVFSFISWSQSPVLLDLNDTIAPQDFTKAPGRQNFFKYHDGYSESGIELFDNGSFIYYNVSEVWFDITYGSYKRKSNLIFLEWDSLQTVKAAADYSVYSRYFKYKEPRPFKISRLIYIHTPLDVLECVTLKHKRIEIFHTSGDIFKKLPQVDSVIKINWKETESKVVIQKEKRRRVGISKDSVWGYKLYNYCNYRYFRFVPKKTNWYGLTEMQVAQVSDHLTVYYLGSERLYPYFSETLDSPAYPLTYNGLKEAFKDRPGIFTSIIAAYNAVGSSNYAEINPATNSYRIIEICRKLTGK